MIKFLLFKSNICEYVVQYKLWNAITIGYIIIIKPSVQDIRGKILKDLKNLHLIKKDLRDKKISNKMNEILKRHKM